MDGIELTHIMLMVVPTKHTGGENMNQLKHYREKAKLSQSQLAEKAGISVRTLQDYEQGRKPLEGARAITVLTLAQSLGCTVEDLIDPKA